MNALVTIDGERAAPDIVSQAERKQYLTFMLGAEKFAVGILQVKEIIEYSGVTAVPMMPTSVRGVINLRGAVVPVVDLAVRFGRPESVVTKRTCIVIVEMPSEESQQVIGMQVDSVSAVVEISSADIEPPPSFGTRIRSDFIAGMGKLNEQFVILLNVDRVMSVDELEGLGQLAQASTSPEAG